MHVKLRGSAKSNEDVAEFLKRLNSSVFFKDVNLDATAQASKGAVKYVNFGLSTTVKATRGPAGISTDGKRWAFATRCRAH